MAYLLVVVRLYFTILTVNLSRLGRPIIILLRAILLDVPHLATIVAALEAFVAVGFASAFSSGVSLLPTALRH